ncbi:MAG: ThuA domain-containing protein, partial [Bacteroidales bacterium]
MSVRIFRNFLAILIFIANLSALRAQKTHEIKLLIVDGFSNHDWQRTTQSIIHILNIYKGFKIDVSTSPDNSATKDQIESWSPDFSAYDVVMLSCNDKGTPVNWGDPTRRSLERFVTSGGGLYIFHSANNGFENWDEYNRMIGLGWRNKNFGKAAIVVDDGTIRVVNAGDGENTAHGSRVNALATRIGNHPIQKGLPKSWIYADIEVYT